MISDCHKIIIWLKLPLLITYKDCSENLILDSLGKDSLDSDFYPFVKGLQEQGTCWGGPISHC